MTPKGDPAMIAHQRGSFAKSPDKPDMKYFYIYIDMKLVSGKSKQEIVMSVDYELAEMRRVMLEELGVESGKS